MTYWRGVIGASGVGPSEVELLTPEQLIDAARTGERLLRGR